MSTRWYLAGKMSYVPQFNFPFFDKVAAALRAQGAVIISPAEMDDPEVRAAALASPDGIPNERTSGGHTWGDFLSRDLKLIADGVDGVAVLPGWLQSKGARQEVFTALNCGKSIAEVIVGEYDTFALLRVSAGYMSQCLRKWMRDHIK